MNKYVLIFLSFFLGALIVSSGWYYYTDKVLETYISLNTLSERYKIKEAEYNTLVHKVKSLEGDIQNLESKKDALQRYMMVKHLEFFDIYPERTKFKKQHGYSTKQKQ